MEWKKNAICTVSIDSCTGNGAGVARLEGGLVVFVQGALRGERCEIKLLKVKRSIAFAKVLRVLAPSPARTEPECPHFPVCGGCVFWHMTYAEELEIKRQQIADALSRIGGFPALDIPMLGADSVVQYRNKAQFPVAETPKGLQIGFYRARSHQVISVDRCLIQSPVANQVAQTVRRWMEDHRISGYDETNRTGLVRHVYVRTNQAGEALVCLVINGASLPCRDELVQRLREACPSVVGVLISRNQRHDNVILGDSHQLLWGSDTLTDTLLGRRFSLSVPSFYQVNHAQTARLYETAILFASLHGTETVLDLYCGVGTISLAMAARAKRVIGVELVPEAVEDARENAARNHVKNAEFFCADAGAAAAKLLKDGVQPDVIVVDPPRKGLNGAVIDAMLELAPGRIVYVSCDPATLARDLKLLTEQGYTLERVCGVDMFPRTRHVETVVLMTRTGWSI